MKKGTCATPATSVPKATRMASPTTLVEEITPWMKKPHVEDKGMEEASSRSSSIWDNASLALLRAQDTFTADELKALFRVPSNELVGCHVHKPIQVIPLCNFLFTFSLFTWF